MRKVEIKMKQNNRFFIAMLSIIMGTVFSAFDGADAASVRTPVRVSTTTARRPATANLNTTTTITETQSQTLQEPATEQAPQQEEITVLNKSSNFDVSLSAVTESSVENNSFAEQIRKQRAALAASDATGAVATTQQSALKNSSNTCDRDLRKCMSTKCGNDFTKCATDGDTMFGDKLNACRRDTECTGEEFSLFTAEIKNDRDMNVRLASYNNVINCGNQYNACIVNECGTTYTKCLGKAKADAATKKCSDIAKSCVEADSGLANRFGTAIGKLRESAEKEVKRDDERMYALRDSMQSTCKRMGAAFDERTFDCIFTVNFFAGNDQKNPMASRKRYAGDTFVCMQEWFGVDTTTYKENAYRETRAQTGASSAMLGAGVGTAVGLVSSGAIGRALDTQKAKKELNKEKELQEAPQKLAEKEAKEAEKVEKKAQKDAEKAQRETEKAEKKEIKAVQQGIKKLKKNNKPVSISESATTAVDKEQQDLQNKKIDFSGVQVNASPNKTDSMSEAELIEKLKNTPFKNTVIDLGDLNLKADQE